MFSLAPQCRWGPVERPVDPTVPITAPLDTLCPFRTFMSATAVGRFPRLFAYAWVGSIFRIPTLVLVGVIFGTAAAVIVYKLLQGKKLLSDTVFDQVEER